MFLARRSIPILILAAATAASAADRRIELIPLVGVRGGATLEADQPGFAPAEADPSVSFGLGLDVGTVDNTVGFSGSLGSGFKAAMGKRLAFKFEVLGYATVNDASLSVTCGPGCFVHFGSSGWYQFAARLGLAIRL